VKQDYLQIRVLEMAPQVYVCGQLFETDMQLLAKQKVRTIVNNRFDDESTGQPKSADLARAAEEYGMTFVHFPVDAISITDEQLKSFAGIADDLERPVFLFSRSGKRSIKLWEKAELL
jgi:uncharacterized protein (TIGR01244 family)